MPTSVKTLQYAKENPKLVSLFARWAADGLYYTASLKDYDAEKRRCQVKFEDNLECWLDAKDIHCQIHMGEEYPEEMIVCCVCEDGTSKVPNEIIMCDTCQQGYHLQCHGPPVDRSEVNLDDEEHEWHCGTCLYMGELRERQSAIRGKGRVENMQPLIIDAARTLLTETTDVGTEEFLNLIRKDFQDAPVQNQSQKRPKLDKGSTRIKKIYRKCEKQVAAAF